MGVAGDPSVQSRVSLREKSYDDVEHLICGCRPHFTLCGGYDPDVTVVVYKDPSPEVCDDCAELWGSRGCTVCRCSADYACEPCLERYLAATD